MTQEILLLFVIFVIGYIVYEHYFNNKMEHYGPGTGALIQLYSKGPEDLNLEVDIEQHIPEYHTWRRWYSHYPWNMPVRRPMYLPWYSNSQYQHLNLPYERINDGYIYNDYLFPYYYYY
jgi:hypothetical protein